MKKININWRSVFSSSPVGDLEKLEEYCSLSPHGDLAIEVGSYEGASTSVIAQYFDSVLAIDPWGEHDVKPGDKIGTYTLGTAGSNSHFIPFNKNMFRLDLLDIVIPIVSTVKVLSKLPLLNAGLIFVDDGHTYDDCIRDITYSIPHLSQNGILVCHDYYNETGGPCGAYIGVTEAVNEAVKTFSLKVIDHSGGIIALKRK